MTICPPGGAACLPGDGGAQSSVILPPEHGSPIDESPPGCGGPPHEHPECRVSRGSPVTTKNETGGGTHQFGVTPGALLASGMISPSRWIQRTPPVHEVIIAYDVRGGAVSDADAL